MKDKLFIIRKYIPAKTASEAIKKESKYPVDDVWWDDDNRKFTTESIDGIGIK